MRLGFELPVLYRMRHVSSPAVLPLLRCLPAGRSFTCLSLNPIFFPALRPVKISAIISFVVRTGARRLLGVQ